MIPTARLNEILNAPNIEELWKLHLSHMAEYGFDRLIYGYSRHLTQTSFGDPQDFVLLTNHDPDYTDGFIYEGLYVNAPMSRWALNNDGACSWSFVNDLIENNELTKEEMRVVEFNHSKNVVAGYSISFKSISPRSKGAIALTACNGVTQEEVDAVWNKHGDDIMALNTLAHLRILTLPHTATGTELTKRQKQVLSWVADGKTIQDIAILMELTPATIEKHLRLARRSLRVETTAQAVLKASFQNQMFVLDN